MAMFTPPAPKTLPPMPVVAPYVSDADTRKKLWELGMRHHLKALEGLGAKGKRHGFNLVGVFKDFLFSSLFGEDFHFD